MGRTGRRPGNTDTRSEILAAARERFAAQGFRGATVRGIAASAGVDPALVHHYFGTKRALFVAAVELPFDPREVVDIARRGEPAEAGERIVRQLLHLWATEAGRRVMESLLRSALVDDDALGLLREFMLETVLLPIVAELAPDRTQLRATLLVSQVMGLAMARYVVEIEPLASADDDTVVAALAPTLQRDAGPDANVLGTDGVAAIAAVEDVVIRALGPDVRVGADGAPQVLSLAAPIRAGLAEQGVDPAEVAGERVREAFAARGR